MTPQEVLDRVYAYLFDADSIGVGSDSSDLRHNCEIDVDEQLGNHSIVYKYGGEGKGDHYETVVYFFKHNVYIQQVGYYTSYDGVMFDDQTLNIVTPQQKTITVYE